MSNQEVVLLVLFATIVLGAVGALSRDVISRKNGSGLVLLIGFATLFIGERFIGEGTSRLVLSLLGVGVIAGAVALRVYAAQESTDERKSAHQQALIWTSVSASSLFLYALSLDGMTDALGLEDEGAETWIGVMWSLFPIATLVGLLPTLLIDRMLALHPVQLPVGATQNQQLSGLAAALAISLMFPVNYLASVYDVDTDVAYFRTTRAGEATLAVVETLSEPVEAYLFFPAGNDVRREITPYFDTLAEASDGRFTVTVADQAVSPELAKELKVNDNGQIVFKMGEQTETFKLKTELDRAKRDLRKLDGTVQKHLVKLTRGPRKLYFLTHHGGMHWRGKTRDQDPLKEFRVTKKLLEDFGGFKIEQLDPGDSTQGLPDDAAAVVIAGAAEELYPEELEVLTQYFNDGGSLFIALDPDGARHAELLAHLGLEATGSELANSNAVAEIRGSGVNPRAILVTNRYGSHASTRQLSKTSARYRMILPSAVAVTEATDARPETEAPKVSVLVRSPTATWADDNNNYKADDGESRKVFPVASAVSLDRGEDQESRAIVFGSSNAMADMFSNPRLAGVANPAFVLDGFKWLLHDEAIVGKVENEEDTKVVQTREDNWIWSLAIIGLVPGLVLTAGLVFLRARQARRQ